MIYLSTGGFHEFSAWETSRKFIQHGIHHIELSGGSYCPDQISLLIGDSHNANYVPHNYFPPPPVPFVVNLASTDPVISKLSFDHISNSIQLSSSLGSRYYSFHAGFLIDPLPSELGKQLRTRELADRSFGQQIFLDRLHQLSHIASDHNVHLLVENNVLSHRVYETFRTNPLLMVDPDETLYIAEHLPDNVSLLIDVAHLKVSARSLSFDCSSFLSTLNPYISAFHLSDNDGFSDTNSPFTEDSWFWPYLKSSVDYYTVEVYSSDLSLLTQQITLAHSIINSRACSL